MLALRRKGRPARDCQLDYPTPRGHIIAGTGTYGTVGTVVRRARTAFYLFIFAVRRGGASMLGDDVSVGP